MNVLAVRESALVSTLLVSIPAVFEQEGTPSDMDFILSYLKKAVCHRGITTSTQKLLVHLLVPLSRFKGGLIDHEELEEKVVWEVPSSLDFKLHIGVEKLTGIEELKELAVKLCDYSKQECLKQRNSSSAAVSAKSTSESEEGGNNVYIGQAKRILYNRDQLLSLRASGSSSADNLDFKLPNIIMVRKDAGHNYSSNPSSQSIADLSAIFPLSSQQRNTPSNGTFSGSPPHTVPLHKTTNFPHTTPSGSPSSPVSSCTTPSPRTHVSPQALVSSRTTSGPRTPVSPQALVSSRTTPPNPHIPASSHATPSPHTLVSPQALVGSRTTTLNPRTPVSYSTPASSRATPSPHTPVSPQALVSSPTPPNPPTPSSTPVPANSSTPASSTPSPCTPVSPQVCVNPPTTPPNPHSPISSRTTTPNPLSPVSSRTYVSSGNSPLTPWECIHGRGSPKKNSSA